MNNRVNISHVNNMHNQWARSLNFFKTEIAILRGLLTEIAGKNTDPELLKTIEHFENQFTIQNNNIDHILHRIHANIEALAKAVRDSSAGYVDGQLLEVHSQLGTDTVAEEKVMMELIHSFREFAARWL